MTQFETAVRLALDALASAKKLNDQILEKHLQKQSFEIDKVDKKIRQASYELDHALKQFKICQFHEPYAWMTTESEWRLNGGGNGKGAVPVHKNKSHKSKIPLYRMPPQKEWTTLTVKEFTSIVKANQRLCYTHLLYDIENKLKEKNT